MNAYKLLCPELQKALYEMGWQRLRPIQEEAIEYLIRPRESRNAPFGMTKAVSDLIVTAPTASGKTEAVFLPLISNICESAKSAVKILYVSPLKALINDQFKRIESLCSQLEFPITPWHGDANQTKKARLVQQPAGILLITPESIEAMFQNRAELLPRLFGQLEYVVIDEIHSFLEKSRGEHLKSLLYRIGIECRVHPVKIGLSATIANPSAAAKWLCPADPESVKTIQDKTSDSGILGVVSARVVHPFQLSDKDKRQLYNYTNKGANLIFANNKAVLEWTCDTMREYVQKQKLARQYCIHHGSLSKYFREEVETKLKQGDNVSVFCTSTLELGIDIGSLNRVVFLNPPAKVSSLIQRMGRSGRQAGQDKEIVFFLCEEPIGSNSDTKDKYRYELVQSIAQLELLTEGWQEPIFENGKDYSTFVHQILSLLGQYRSVPARRIYQVIARGAFNDLFSQAELMETLFSLKNNKLIEQKKDGSVVLTEDGERIVEDSHFYASFASSDEWSIRANGTEIGRISSDDAAKLVVGSVFLLAGKRWQVLQIYLLQKLIVIQQTSARKTLSFSGLPADVHPVIERKMHELYKSRYFPPYITAQTKEILEGAYDQYRVDSANKKWLLTMNGTKIHRTLLCLIDWLEIPFHDEDIAFSCPDGAKTVKAALKKLDFSRLPCSEILSKSKSPFKTCNKYDYLLSEELLNQSYLINRLDIQGTKEFCERL